MKPRLDAGPACSARPENPPLVAETDFDDSRPSEGTVAQPHRHEYAHSVKLDLTSWKRALASLERAVSRSTAAPKDEELRDAVIQRFEYSYELSWKMLKRHLEQVVPDPGAVDHWSFKELMREGAERGLIAAVDPWIEYRYQRNMTAHAYDEEKARRVYESAQSFLIDARAVLAEVERRNVD
jgi:nucleotidyltransferase substrate binding protein (TIGR01987 family)